MKVCALVGVAIKDRKACWGGDSCAGPIVRTQCLGVLGQVKQICSSQVGVKAFWLSVCMLDTKIHFCHTYFGNLVESWVRGSHPLPGGPKHFEKITSFQVNWECGLLTSNGSTIESEG